MNLSNAFPGTYAAVATAAPAMKSKDRMLIKSTDVEERANVRIIARRAWCW